MFSIVFVFDDDVSQLIHVSTAYAYVFVSLCECQLQFVATVIYTCFVHSPRKAIVVYLLQDHIVVYAMFSFFLFVVKLLIILLL